MTAQPLPLPPLKESLPWLRYDLAAWCEVLLNDIHPYPFPNSLADLRKDAEAMRDSQPDLPKETPRLRVYIIDQRLRVLMALTDTDGETSNTCYRFARYAHRYEDNLLGEGRVFIDALDYDAAKIARFVKRYDISPIEYLSVPSLAIMEGAKLSNYHRLGSWQTASLLERYRDQNLVDWAAWSSAVSTY